MSQRPQDQPDFSQQSLRTRIDILCDAFEREWIAGKRPRLEDYLADTSEPERSTLLKDLLDVELEYRQKHGEQPTVDEYLSRFPEASRRMLLKLVMIDLERRWRRDSEVPKAETPAPTDETVQSAPGERPLLEDYTGRFPALGPVDQLPADMIAFEYRVRHLWGDRPQHSEYFARFPDRRNEIAAGMIEIDRELARNEETIEGSPRQSDTDRTQQPKALKIRCPHCRNPVEIVDDTPLAEISCPSCGSSFGVIGDEALAHETRGGSQRRRQTVGHFELLEQIGYGAFGSVWKARDTQLDRIVAVKLPRRGQLTAEETEKFVREARAAAQLRHPNIVSVHEVGLEDDLIYIVSDFIDGMSLADRLTGPSLSFREAAELCTAVADALHYAHEQGVIHRDLKPSNIMITSAGEPCLMDFGLAKREAGEMTVTMDGEIIGTPAYMSPEQAKGEAHAADRRSDVYSFGVILFEVLTGERPFRGNMRMLLKQVIGDESPSPRKLDGRIPRDLETICLKCLEKEPRRRYQSASELAADLRRWMNKEPIKARPITWFERGVRLCQRRPLAAGLSGAVSLLMLATLMSTTIGYWHVSLARRDAEEERYRALRSEREAIRLRDAEAIARQEAETEREKARESLRRSLIHQAWAVRRGTLADRRGQAMDALKSAAEVRPGLDLRNEYIRCLELPGFRPVSELSFPDGDAGLPKATIDRLPVDIRREFAARSIWMWGSVTFGESDDRVMVVPPVGQPAEFDARTGKLLSLLSARGKTEIEGPVPVLTPDFRFLAAQKPDGPGSEVWDIKEQRLLDELKDGDGRPIVAFGFAFSQRADFLAAAKPSSDRSAIFLYEIDSLRLVKTWEVEGSVWCLCFHPQGKALAASIKDGESHDHEIHMWTLPEGKELPALTLERDVDSTVPFMPGRIDFSDGPILAAGGVHGLVKAWDFRLELPEVFSVSAHDGGANAVQLSPDGEWVATWGEDGLLKVWQVSSGELVVRERPGPFWGSHIGKVHWSPSGSLLLSSTASGYRVWEFARPLSRSYQLRLRQDIKGRRQRRNATLLAFSPNEHWLACGADSILEYSTDAPPQ